MDEGKMWSLTGASALECLKEAGERLGLAEAQVRGLDGLFGHAVQGSRDAVEGARRATERASAAEARLAAYEADLDRKMRLAGGVTKEILAGRRVSFEMETPVETVYLSGRPGLEIRPGKRTVITITIDN